jgi:hypothetical protein
MAERGACAGQRTQSRHAQETHGAAQGPRDAGLSRCACMARYDGGPTWRASDVTRVGAFLGKNVSD